MIPAIVALLEVSVGGENMPGVGSIETTNKSGTHSKGKLSLAITILLCLPSLIGGTAYLINLLLYQDAAEWGQLSGALVGLGGILGRPLTAVAAVVGATTAFRGSVSPNIKYAHLVIVSLATVASLFFLYRLGI